MDIKMDDVKDESAEGEMKSELDDLMDCLMNKEKITHPIATVAVCRASQTCRLPSSRDSITSIAPSPLRAGQAIRCAGSS